MTSKTLKFHVNPVGKAVRDLTGHQVPNEVGVKLEKLAGWLVTEAIDSGGIGPNEGPDVIDRHILGSAAFAIGFPQAPEACWDLGSGVGLPGLVLAMIWPSTRMTLVESSQKRCDLARRASRMLDVEVKVLNQLLEDLTGQVAGIVSRGARPAADLRPIIERHLAPGGVAVVSGSTAPVAPGFSEVEIPQGVLHHAARLLMMRSP